jgi:hypothetical protein
MKRLLLTAACCVAIAGCASDPERTPTPSRPAPESPAAPPAPATVSAQDAAAICKISASTKFGVGLTDVAVSSARKVDAGWLTRVTIGTVEKNCVVTPTGAIRSLQ